MARMYKVSADVSEKEKAVGGIMTFGQAGWLVLGFLMALILGIPPGVAFGCIFAFYKKEGLPLSTYIIYKRSFEKKSKQMVNDLIYGKTFAKEDELFG